MDCRKVSTDFWQGSIFFMPKRSVFLSLTVYRNLGMFFGETILGYWIIVHLLVYQLINSWGAETCALIIEFSLLKYELKFSSKSSFELCFRVCSSSKTVLFCLWLKVRPYAKHHCRESRDLSDKIHSWVENTTLMWKTYIHWARSITF